jgi:pimeloyl-ACP methyl ester carboxylesterase
MKYIVKIFFVCLIFLGGGTYADATTTISQEDGETLSRSHNFSTVYQQLGTNLSGTLTSIDLKWYVDMTYYGVGIGVSLIECDSPGYSPDPIHCAHEGESVVPEATPSTAHIESGVRNVDIEDYELNPQRYYFIKVRSWGPFASMGVFNLFGSSGDTYEQGSLCSVNSPQTHNPCVNNELIGDLFFVLHGAVRTPPCTEYCYASVMFLPGLEASRLYRPDYNGGTETLWEPNSAHDVEDLFLDETGESVRTDVYTKDVVDEVYSTALLGNIYKSFLDALQSWKTEDRLIKDFSAVPYDWRLTMSELLSYGNNIDGRIYYAGENCATTSPYIISELRRLAQESGNGKVAIVAHSNGGLLAKALLKKLQDDNDPLLEKIESVFLVAVPQTGTPHAIGALLHGYDQGLPKDWFASIVSRGLARDFGKNMAGAYPLLPSSSFWNGEGGAVGLAPIRFDEGGFTEIDNAKSFYGGIINTKDELWSFLRGEEGRSQPAQDVISSPSLLNPTLLSYADTLHDEIDTWVPPAYIAVHQIAGWGEDTLASIVYRKKNTCVRFVNNTCAEYGVSWTYKPEFVVDGDGTVVVPSALAMSTSYSNVKRWWVDLKRYDTITNLEREHKDILEIPGLIGFIKNKISTSTESESFVTSSQPPSDSQDRLYFYLHSPLDLSAVDSLGNVLSSTTSAIPGARYKRLGEVQYISIPQEAFPTIHLNGFALGFFDLEVEEKTGENVSTTTFVSIPTQMNTVASMVFGDGTIVGASPLSIDYEDDGVIDEVLEPVVGETVTVPPVVFDNIAPEVIIGFSTTTRKIEFVGIDNNDPQPSVNTEGNITIIRDSFENSLHVKHSLKNKHSQSEIVLTQLVYSTTTEFIYEVKSFARYFWIKNPKNAKYLVFVSHIKTSDENIITLYDTSKNKTSIITVAKNTESVDLEGVIKKLPKNAIIKKTLSGLVIPYLETKAGKIIIRY